ncbi:MAG: DTW domain-containing protein YfiP [Sulfurimonas sp.]|jgi:DTW domain-containing protein YfiP
MCQYISPFETNTKFVILMHPKEFKKVKNNTGYFTKESLLNAELFMGIDFSDNKRINDIIDTHDSYILYPSENALDLSSVNPQENKKTSKSLAIFLIDSTWACTRKIFNESTNLQNLKHMSFTTSRESQYGIKEQPRANYLSTIESTHVVLELLEKWKIEELASENLENFLNPFFKMIEYQKELIENSDNNTVRFKKHSKI